MRLELSRGRAWLKPEEKGKSVEYRAGAVPGMVGFDGFSLDLLLVTVSGFEWTFNQMLVECPWVLDRSLVSN